MKPITIPTFLSHLPTYKGLPVPSTVYVDKDGVPDFKVTDQVKWMNIVAGRCCGICGNRLPETMFFIGGEKSCVAGTFFDPAMCEPCARFSMNVCPFLNFQKGYAEHIKEHIGSVITIDPNMSTEKPKKMGLLRTDGFRVEQHGEQLYLRAKNKLNIEWFEP